MPTRGSALSAGYDMYSAEDIAIPKRGKALVDLQLSIACPEGTYGRIAPRSGLGQSEFDRMTAWLLLISEQRQSTPSIPALVSSMRTTEDQSRFYCSIIPMRTLRVSSDFSRQSVRKLMFASVKVGDRVAQLILERIAMVPFMEVDVCISLAPD